MSSRPSKEDLVRASGRTVPDLIATDLAVLFCGINPSLWSAAVGHHFARPGNRFWKVLAGAGFTPELLAPTDERRLLEYGIGITNLVPRATAAAAELGPEELREGAQVLEVKVRDWSPRCVAIVGMGAYRTGFGRPRAGAGEQSERLGGARVWVLPNPSGLQAHYQLPELVTAFAELRRAIADP